MDHGILSEEFHNLIRHGIIRVVLAHIHLEFFLAGIAALFNILCNRCLLILLGDRDALRIRDRLQHDGLLRGFHSILSRLLLKGLK